MLLTPVISASFLPSSTFFSPFAYYRLCFWFVFLIYICALVVRFHLYSFYIIFRCSLIYLMSWSLEKNCLFHRVFRCLLGLVDSRLFCTKIFTRSLFASPALSSSIAASEALYIFTLNWSSTRARKTYKQSYAAFFLLLRLVIQMCTVAVMKWWSTIWL